MATIMPLYNSSGVLIGYVMPDDKMLDAFPSSPAPAVPAAPPARRKATSTSRKADRRIKAALAYVTDRSGVHGVTFVARVLSCDPAFKGLAESTIQQFLYKLVREGVIGSTPDHKLYAPPVPADASSLTAADVA